MNIHRIVIVSIALAVVVALPISNWLSDLQTKYGTELERSRNLQLKVETIQKQVEVEALETDRLKEQNKILNDQKSQLEKDLQAKRERQAEEARLAAIKRPIVLTAVGGSGSCSDEIRKYDWPHSVALAVMNGESSNIAGRVNNNPGTGDYSIGCFQVNLYGGLARSRPSEEWLKVAANNVSYSYNMYIRDGRTFCKPSGWINTCRKLGLI